MADTDNKKSRTKYLVAAALVIIIVAAILIVPRYNKYVMNKRAQALRTALGSGAEERGRLLESQLAASAATISIWLSWKWICRLKPQRTGTSPSPGSPLRFTPLRWWTS